jgi:hypothetical protein
LRHQPVARSAIVCLDLERAIAQSSISGEHWESARLH